MLETRRQAAVEAARYEIRDRIVVHKLPTNDPTFLNFWCPIIPDLPYQRVLNLEVELRHPFNLLHEKEHGNLLLYSHLEGTLPREIHLEIKYRVERLPLVHTAEDFEAGDMRSNLIFAKHLSAEQNWAVHPKTKELAGLVAGDRVSVLEKARRLYDYVVENSLGSEDSHALFVSLCRAVGIPARFAVGEELDAFGEEETAGSPHPGVHVWAEFFAPGHGWLPVDTSYACRYQRSLLFGNVPQNHIVWSLGRDILLQPPQNGGRLLFFVGPYVEVGGRIHPFTFRKISSREISHSATQ